MLRAIFVGLISIGCAAETYTEEPIDPDCDWSVVMTVSVSEEAGDCSWSIRSRDTELTRLRSVFGEPSGSVEMCAATVYTRIDSLRPTESVEVWSEVRADRDAIWAALEMSHCL